MPLSQEVERGLKELFNDPNRTNWPVDDHHAHGTYSQWSMEVEFCEENISWIKITGSVPIFPKTIGDLAKEILAYLGDGQYGLQVVLYDDFAKWVKEVEEKLRSLDPSNKQNLNALPFSEIDWHQDKFGRNDTNYDYVYFNVLEIAGVLSEQNILQLGTIFPHDSRFERLDFVDKVAPEHVKVIKSIEGVAGAGYFVDQNFMTEEGRIIVHRRGKLKIIVTNFDPTEDNFEHPFFDGCKKPNNEYNCLAPEYKRPTRKTLVVRIKRLNSKNSIFQAGASHCKLA